MASRRKAFKIVLFSILILLLLPALVLGECTCDEEDGDRNKIEALKYKIGALVSILVSSAIGVCIPILGKKFPVLSPDKDLFYFIKAFAAGVILSTGFIHVLPDAFESLGSPCLKENQWQNFPFAGFIATVTAMGTLMVDTLATSYYNKHHSNKNPEVVPDDEEKQIGEHEGHVHVHTHATRGHAHGALSSTDSSGFLRYRVVSQVLELGIVVHSVIIGISMGASESPSAIKPLVAALTFHQFFEGMGLGGCIAQAKFKTRSVVTMLLFFALTTPVGIAIGMGISSVYEESSPTALIVEGVLNSASAGILIYMALVDLLAADFMSPRVQNSGRLQIGTKLSLVVGAGCMSLLAIWA